jgi:hypothetical protein
MKRNAKEIFLSMVSVVAVALATCGTFKHLHGQAHAAERGGDVAGNRNEAPAKLAEARKRARLLHETLHGALQVMHRDFFRDDEGSAIPSRSLEDVFTGLVDRFDVELRWLAVNADAMSIDHSPQTDFERKAVKALAAGKQEFETSEGNLYRYAGSIRLSSQCLKCHAPRRTSTEDRAAGLVISMPFKD